MSTPDLLYGEVEEELRASVRDMLADRCSLPSVLARTESGQTTDLETWRLLVEMGCTGLVIPERHGGSGDVLAAAVVLEELGRAVAPVPYLGSLLASFALVEADDAELLAAIAAGSLSATLAVGLATAPAPAPTPAVTAAGGGAEAALTGTVAGVADALCAQVLVVPANDGLYAVAATGPAVTRTPVVSLDMTRQLCDITFAAAPARRLADADTGRRALSAALLAGAALLASEQLGVARWCLDEVVAYGGTRRQFGRQTGSFQAVKHRLADVWVDQIQATATARYAARCLAEGDPDLPVAASLAQAHCSVAAQRAAEECLQLHGGIGFTWEHPTHLYLKRAKSSSIALGTAHRHRRLIGGLVGLSAPTVG